MELQRDDIIIRKGIIHILDSHNGYLGLSNDLLDMGPDLMEFIRGHIFKILDSDDTKKCQFDGSISPIPALLEDMQEKEDDSFIAVSRVLAESLFDIMCDDDTKKCQFDGSISPIPALLEDMQEKEDDSFIAVSRVLAESLFDIMCDSVTIPAADLVVVSFQLHSVVHLALLKMNYKETYVHKEAENEVNDIVKQRIMPMGGAKLTEAVIVDLLEHKVQLVEKKYEMLTGDKINYISERFLQCHADMAPKKKFQILNKVITDINNRYENEPLRNRMDARSKLREEFAEKNEFRVNEIGDRIFGDDAEKKSFFDYRMERYDLQYDKFSVGKENTVKGLEYIIVETDSGIEIKIPMEEYITKDNVEIVEEPGGGSTVVIRNIEQAKIK